MAMFPDGRNINSFHETVGDQFPPFINKPPTNKDVNQNRPSPDSGSEENSEEDLKPKDAARGGLDKAISWTTPSPTTATSSDSPFQVRTFPPRITNETHFKAFKINKTSEKGFSPLIQVYVITSGNGGAHTSIGEGGYHGINNGHSANGFPKINDGEHNIEPPNVKVQTFHDVPSVPRDQNPAYRNDSTSFSSGKFDETSKRNSFKRSKSENIEFGNNGEFSAETKRKVQRERLRDDFPVFWLRKKRTINPK
ncbi:hypothetical protein NPIL_16841 [Nephila pilipes]|uniref:Uncharacterized protein n=2 Tax=Nephila pilipes TaxID=299642 RepID=A0A8X6PG58_NEPPI|nr:hypothetical protein NPIL_16841 [Nephila pilipes]